MGFTARYSARFDRPGTCQYPSLEHECWERRAPQPLASAELAFSRGEQHQQGRSPPDGTEFLLMRFTDRPVTMVRNLSVTVALMCYPPVLCFVTWRVDTARAKFARELSDAFTGSGEFGASTARRGCGTPLRAYTHSPSAGLWYSRACLHPSPTCPSRLPLPPCTVHKSSQPYA